MDERDSSERFEQAWQDRQRGGDGQQDDLPGSALKALETADRLARADYSHESQVRESLRQRLLDQEIPKKFGKTSANRVLWGSLRFAAGAAFILFMVAGLAWSIRNLIPSQGPAGSQLSQQFAPGPETGVISPTLSTATPLPVAVLPTASALPTQAPIEGISYVVQAGDTLTSIAYQFGVSLDSLLQLNGLSLDSTIYVGQILTVGASQPVAVQPGVGLANLRSGPGTDYPVVGQVSEGEQVSAMGKSSDGSWLMVESSQTPGGVAWVSAALVAPVDVDVPVVQTPPDEATATPESEPAPPPVAASSAITLTLVDGPTRFEQSGASGELYFLVRPLAPPTNRQLYHAQTACLVSQSQCPAGLVSGFPQAEDNPLYWSPDGSQAALVSSTTSELLIYTPQSQTWLTAQAPFSATVSLALWSPDGYWIATSLQNLQDPDAQSSLLTLIHPEGTPYNATLRTPAADLGGVQVPLGWLSADELLFMRYQTQPKGQQGEASEPRLYRFSLSGNTSEELTLSNGWEWLKSYPAPSPDGEHIALSLPNGDQSELAVTDLSGVEQMSFGVNGQMPAWSPDSQLLAYVVQQQASAEVYVSAWDGSNPRKAFEWTSTPTIAWSPDSQSLLIAAYPGGSSSEMDRVLFFLYSLADGRLKEIHLQPDSAENDLLAPSFQPPVSP
jgi:Tol biopolymer transport system component/LysM repeat protein